MRIDEQKKALRQKVRALKKEVSLADKKSRSECIWQQLEQMKDFQSAKVVMFYWSMEDEVYTHAMVQKWAGTKTILLPSVNGVELELKVFEGMHSMKAGEHFGILEPIGSSFEEHHKIDLIIVPGVAFDKMNNRMGRGKAYYDKLLKTTTCPKIGVCFSFQYFDEVPTDQYDIKMDRVIVERSS